MMMEMMIRKLKMYWNMREIHVKKAKSCRKEFSTYFHPPGGSSSIDKFPSPSFNLMSVHEEIKMKKDYYV